MKLRARLAALGGAGAMMVAPILIGAQPAAAAVRTTQKTTDFFFGDFQDNGVQCTVILKVLIDTSAKTLEGVSGVGAGGAFSNECFDTTLRFTVDYRDSFGHAQHVVSGGNGTGSVTVSNFGSNAKISLDDTFLQCNDGTNATCHTTVTIAPK